MENIELLLQGFEPEYVVPDDIIETIETLIKHNEQTNTSNSLLDIEVVQTDLGVIFDDLIYRTDALVTTLADKTKKIDTVLSDNGEAFLLPSVEEYKSLVIGNPDLNDIERIQAYEEHHIGEKGNIDVFLYDDALEISSELRHIKEDPTYNSIIKKVPELISDGKTTREDPNILIWDYYYNKAQLLRQVVNALETAAEPVSEDVSEKTIREVLGNTDSIVLIGDSWEEFRTECKKGNTILRQAKALLKLYYYSTCIDIASSIDRVRCYTHNYLLSTLNQAKLNVLSELYSVTIKPAVEWSVRVTTESPLKIKGVIGKALNPFIMDMMETALYGAMTELLKLQQEIVNLAREDREKYLSYKEKSDKISSRKRAKFYLDKVEHLINILEQAEASSSPNSVVLQEIFKHISVTRFEELLKEAKNTSNLDAPDTGKYIDQQNILEDIPYVEIDHD